MENSFSVVVFCKSHNLNISNIRLLETITNFANISHIVFPKNRKTDKSDELIEFIRLNGIIEKCLPYKKNLEETLQLTIELKKSKPDLMITYFYPQLISSEILAIPNLGTINFHPAILPDYRGAHVINWMILKGEKNAGITLHYIDEGIDTGDIIHKETIPIEFEDTAFDLEKKVIEKSIQILPELLPSILSGKNKRLKQDRTNYSYKPRRPEDGEFSWDWDSKRIYNQIRALVSPWPGAFFFDSTNKKVVVDFFVPLSEIQRIQDVSLYEDGESLMRHLENVLPTK